MTPRGDRQAYIFKAHSAPCSATPTHDTEQQCIYIGHTQHVTTITFMYGYHCATLMSISELLKVHIVTA